jgi:hypothetical protein
LFTGEELFLFSLTKLALGLDNTVLVDQYFGGSDLARWSKGYPWFLRYLDRRYNHVLGCDCLVRWLDDMPLFAAAIENKLRQRSTWIHPVTGELYDVPGIEYEPGAFNIFGFMDCSIFEINTPGTGPVGDWINAPRRPFAYDIQRSVYTNFKKLHGLKLLSIVLPNGISVVWGPVSTRR